MSQKIITSIYAAITIYHLTCLYSTFVSPKYKQQKCDYFAVCFLAGELVTYIQFVSCTIWTLISLPVWKDVKRAQRTEFACYIDSQHAIGLFDAQRSYSPRGI